MKQLYLFSGLGADGRVFKYLDFTGFETTFINWIKPNANEPIEAYAKRLAAQITTENPILIGLSFGGIMAVEVAKLIGTKKIILLASAKTKHEVPFYYRAAGKLQLHKLLPVALMKKTNAFSNWLFGAGNKADKQILKSILEDTDPVFLKWAIDKIANWQNEKLHPNLVHIHGTADRILPIQFVKCNEKIIGGGHFMTLNKAAELTVAINKYL